MVSMTDSQFLWITVAMGATFLVLIGANWVMEWWDRRNN